MTSPSVVMHPLSPSRLADFMAFFDGDAFSARFTLRRTDSDGSVWVGKAL
jgi:hypothetical protein